MKNWKIPSIVMVILILSFAFRWGDLGTTTNNGTTIKTKADHWNGSIWQDTIKNGSYSEKLISPSWYESNRKPIDKDVDYQEPVYTYEPYTKSNNPILDNILKDIPTRTITSYITKTKTVQEAPVPIYLLSSNGLAKIWTYVTSVIGMWLIVAFAITQRKKQKTMKR